MRLEFFSDFDMVAPLNVSIALELFSSITFGIAYSFRHLKANRAKNRSPSSKHEFISNDAAIYGICMPS